MLLISNKVRALTALLSPFAFSCSFSRILLRAFAHCSACAFFLAKPLQLAGMSVASGTATFIRGSLTVSKKVNVISRVISSNPEGFKRPLNSDRIRFVGVAFLFLKRQKSRKDLLDLNSLHILLNEVTPLIRVSMCAR